MPDSRLLFTEFDHIKYNGFTFNELVKTSFSMEAIYNEPETAVVEHKYTLTVDAIISPEGNITDPEYDSRPASQRFSTPNDPLVDGDSVDNTNNDLSMEAIRSRLGVSGAVLSLTGKGMGAPSIIYGNIVPVDSDVGPYAIDIRNGPKPRTILWEPLGCNLARVVWTVEFSIVENTFQENSDYTRLIPGVPVWLVDSHTTVSMNVNKYGFAGWTYRMYLRIQPFLSVTSKSEGGLNQNWSNSSYRLANIYERLLSTYRVHDQGQMGQVMRDCHVETTCEFHPNGLEGTITEVYTQIESPHPYPVGVVEIDAEHSISSRLMNSDQTSTGFMTWMNNLDVEITLRPLVPKIRAWAIFVTLASQRIGQGITVQTNTSRLPWGEISYRINVPIILSLEINESIFKNTLRFQISWSTATSSLNLLFQRTGMFKTPDFSTDWNEWHLDTRTYSQRYGGSAGVVLYDANNINANDITKVANSRKVINSYSTNGRPTSGDQFGAIVGTASRRVPEIDEGIVPIFTTECPPLAASWMAFQNNFELISSKGEVSFRRYKNKTTRDDDETDNTSIEGINLPKDFDQSSVQSEYILQDMGNDTHIVVMKGYAVRAGAPTQPPIIKSYGGKPVRRLKDGSRVATNVISANAKCPVHFTTWTIRYEVLGTPQGNLEEERDTSGEKQDYQ